MAEDYQYFPTKWPLIEFYLGIWKLRISIGIMRESQDNLSYEYVAFLIYWVNKPLVKFKLYDTQRRVKERLENR